MITYVKGDATYPEKTTPNKMNLIVHVVNDALKWGKGFVLAISKRWSLPEYRFMTNYNPNPLGSFESVQVEKNVWVINLYGQHGIANKYITIPPVRYDAIKKGLLSLRKLMCSRPNLYPLDNFAIHMPKIGCGLAGGDWSIVNRLVEDVFPDVDVYVYEP